MAHEEELAATALIEGLTSSAPVGFALIGAAGGLDAALRAVAEQQSAAGGFEVELEVDPGAIGRRDELLLSIARELLTNAARHARASRVELTLSCISEGLVLEITDDGGGLPAGREREVLAEGHIGLATSVERAAAAVGGRSSRSQAAGPALGSSCPSLERFARGQKRAVPPNGGRRGCVWGSTTIGSAERGTGFCSAPDARVHRRRPCRLSRRHGAAGRRASVARVVGEAADGNEALLGVVALQPDVALLDIRMPGLTGFEVCRRLRADGSAPATRVVLITSTPDRVISAEAADAGAVALLAKETPPATICAELRGGRRGPSRVGRRVGVAARCAGIGPRYRRRTRYFAPQMARVGVHPVELTSREREILLLTADGRSAPDIAWHLHLSSATVNTTLLSSFEKLGVYDRAGAVAAALKSGLLE